jgi:hypothetical protein
MAKIAVLNYLTRIEIDAQTRIFYIANGAHNHADTAAFHLKEYKRIAAKVKTAQDWHDMVEHMEKANEATIEAVAALTAIGEIIRDNPSLQVGR